MGLLNQIANGEVVLPAIQRNFVWTEAQTETLLDSIMRGYPIGIALLWETYNDIQYRVFDPDFREGMLYTFRDNTPPRRLRVVLDGQQRLQSLYIALHGHRDGKSLYFDVLSGQRWDESDQLRYGFDFLMPADVARDNKESETEAADDTQETPIWWVSVRELFKMSAGQKRELAKDLTKRLHLSDDEELALDENLGTFDEVFTRQESILKLATIDENLTPDSPQRKTETDVLEIFVRINREGTALRRSDLIFSLLKLNWRESAEGLPEFVDAINEGNSFDLDTDFVVRCLFAVSGLGGKLEIDLLRKQSNVEELQANYEQCCSAIRAAIDFVRDECACQSSRVLGGATMLVPVVHYLYSIPRHEVPNDQVERLRTGVYLLALATPFSRWGESRVGNFVRATADRYAKGDYAFPLDYAIQRVREWERIGSLRDLAENNHLMTLHLIQGMSGAKVQYARNSPEVDHIFPLSELRKREFEEEEINDVANFWILAQGRNRNKSNRKPKEYFADVPQRTLDKALIDRKLLEYRSFRRFLRIRRAAMLSKLEAKVGVTDADFKSRR
jgi:hypothetical protein